MKVTLKEIVLYSLNGSVRRLKLRPDGMNIITGESKTGKSAIIHIVDYCLGSSECHVPEGVIRRKVSWYAVILQREGDTLFLGRQNPERGRATSSNIYVEAGRVEPPGAGDLAKNSDIDALASLLTKFIGIEENLHVPAEGFTRPPLAASFSHARIYCYQDQSLIDNKNQLFFNQNDSFVAQAIRDTLPFFVGAVTSQELRKQQALATLRRELRLLERQVESDVKWEETAAAKASALLAEARNVGLVSSELRHTTVQRTLAALADALRASTESVSDLSGVESELEELLTERASLRVAYTEIRDRLEEAKAFGSNRAEYEGELSEQSSRLRALNIIPPISAVQVKCPLCESDVESPNAKLAELRSELDEVSQRITALRERNPRLQHYVTELEAQLGEAGDRIRDNQNQINAVIRQSEALRSQQEAAVRNSRIQGRISAFLEDSAERAPDELRIRLALLQREVELLSGELGGEAYEDRLRRADSFISDYMTEYARDLELEHSDGRTRLDFRRLTVVADTRHGSIRLENMGSGDNWVGCHVLTHMALHRWFRENDRPVPAFLILDQPSKAHYPPEEQVLGAQVKDDDRIAVLRLFRFIARRTHEGGGFQTLVIDHADGAEQWFQDAVVERWRGGEKLVPDEWPEAF